MRPTLREFNKISIAYGGDIPESDFCIEKTARFDSIFSKEKGHAFGSPHYNITDFFDMGSRKLILANHRKELPLNVYEESGATIFGGPFHYVDRIVECNSNLFLVGCMDAKSAVVCRTDGSYAFGTPVNFGSSDIVLSDILSNSKAFDLATHNLIRGQLVFTFPFTHFSLDFLNNTCPRVRAYFEDGTPFSILEFDNSFEKVRPFFEGLRMRRELESFICSAYNGLAELEYPIDDVLYLGERISKALIEIASRNVKNKDTSRNEVSSFMKSYLHCVSEGSDYLEVLRLMQ